MGFLSKLFASTPKRQPFHLDDRNFDREVIRTKEPVIVDVWGSRCASCKPLEAVMMELAGVYEGRVKVCELNAESAPRAMMALGIRATPTVLYFKDGKELERITGFRSSVYHRETIEELFAIRPE